MIRHVYSRCAPVAVFIRYSLNASGSRHRDVAVHKTDVEPHHGHLYEIKKNNNPTTDWNTDAPDYTLNNSEDSRIWSYKTRGVLIHHLNPDSRDALKPVASWLVENYFRFKVQGGPTPRKINYRACKCRCVLLKLFKLCMQSYFGYLLELGFIYFLIVELSTNK